MHLEPDLACFTIRSDLVRIRCVAGAVRGFCEPILAPGRAIELEIGLVEALNNVVLHAYAGRQGSILVRISAWTGRVSVEIEDAGTPADPALWEPRSKPPADPMDLSTFTDHGFGTALIKRVFDEVTYSRVDARNRLSLVKNCG